MVKVEKIENISDLSLIEHQILFEKIKQQAKDNPETAESLLPGFYGLLDGEISSFVLLPTVINTLAAIIKNFSTSKISETISDIYLLNKGYFLEKGACILCMNNQQCAEVLFNHFAKQFSQTQYSDNNSDFFVSLADNIAQTMSYMRDDEIISAFDIIHSFEQPQQKMLFAIYGNLFEKCPCLREAIWEKISTFRVEKTSDFTILYKNLKSVVVKDVSKISQCLYLINISIMHPEQDSSSLRAAYKTLGVIREYEEYKEKADIIIMRGLLHHGNSASSRKYGYAQLEKTDEIVPHFTMYQRVERTQNNVYGLQHVESVVPDEPVLLFLGGNGTVDEKSANVYLTTFEKLLNKNHIKDVVKLYATVYNFDDSDYKAENFYDYVAHVKLMQNYQQSKKIVQDQNEDIFHTQYVDELFEKFFLKRLVDDNGNRLSFQQACLNMRKITIVAHCHGAYTFMKLEEKIEQKMLDFWYLPEECLLILHELMCIAHSPYIPLGLAKSTMISFVSTQDIEISQYKDFEYEIQNMTKNNEFMLSYFPGQQGEMFLVPSMGEGLDKHKLLDYNQEQNGLNKNGQAILIFASNTIINSIKNSIEGNMLPPIKDIVCGQDEKLKTFFDVLQANGVKIWSKISVQLQSQNETNKE